MKTSPETQSNTENVARKAIDALVERVLGLPPNIVNNEAFTLWCNVNQRFREELADAVVMTGAIDGKVTQPFGQALGCYDTHTCIAFWFKPIEKPKPAPSKIELLRALRHLGDETFGPNSLDEINIEYYNELADRLEAHKGELK